MAKRDDSRAKLLGELIQKARTHARQTTASCAEVLGISQEAYESAEAGVYDLSLPDLETLGIFLDVPMGYFWGTDTLDDEPDVDYDEWMTLRHRVIGVLMSQLRIQSRKSHEELAEHLGVDEDRIKAYETGEVPIPYLHLESLCRFMGGSPSDFMDEERGPLGRHQAKHKLKKQFDRMTPEMQQFLVNPVTMSYLDTAKRISDMDVDKLRQVAESLLDITY
ncbi:MAG: helix-turn-helix transcriptional regulator [Anaerolineales bacterium]|nr:helix-turn-helix transcriptional regulator [Anaerolineales bacterium]